MERDYPQFVLPCHPARVHVQGGAQTSGLTLLSFPSSISHAPVIYPLIPLTPLLQHLMNAQGNARTTGNYAAFYRGLFVYDDNGPMPELVDLGRGCLHEDPSQRPTFDEVRRRV